MVGTLLSALGASAGVVGVGIDLVDVARIERLLERHGDKALARFLTDAERGYVRSMARPALHVAARIAAKEAVFKALQALPGGDTVGWQDIEVTKALGGRPGARLYGGARRLEEEYGSLDVLLSLTHTDSAAAAVAIVTVARRGKMEREARKKRASTVGLKKRSS